MKIVIVGCGKVGKNIASSLLNEGHDIVLVDKNEKTVEEASNALDVLGVIGNGASYETLNNAGVKDADLLLAITDSDELNLLCCFFAKKVGDCKTIARVRDPMYYNEVKYIKDELGLTMIINPEMAAAREIASLLRFPSAIHIDSFERGRVELLSFVVNENSILANKKIMDSMRSLKSRVLVAGIQRNEDAIIPNGNTVIKVGDTVSVVSSIENSTAFFKELGIIRNKVHNCLIVGGSNTAYYLATLLERSNIKTTIVEQDEKRCHELASLLPKVTIINGDGSSDELLNEEGLKEAEGFVSLTNFDEENIIMSMYASNSSNAKVITKINRISYGSLVNSLNVGSVISPKDITADYIIQFVRAMDNDSSNDVETLYHVLNNKAEAIMFSIKENDNVVNVPFEKLNLKKNLLICAILRNSKYITPTGKDSIQIGDNVIIMTTNKGIKTLSGLLDE